MAAGPQTPDDALRAPKPDGALRGKNPQISHPKATQSFHNSKMHRGSTPSEKKNTEFHVPRDGSSRPTDHSKLWSELWSRALLSAFTTARAGVRALHLLGVCDRRCTDGRVQVTVVQWHRRPQLHRSAPVPSVPLRAPARKAGGRGSTA